MEPVRAVLDRVLPPIISNLVCPLCGTRGGIELFEELANNGLGLRCAACERRHPFRDQGLQWIPQSNGRRPNAIATLLKEADHRCHLCGLSKEQLAKIGRALTSHHVDPYAAAGDEGRQIPLCTQCHEIARALQHSAGRLVQRGIA